MAAAGAREIHRDDDEDFDLNNLSDKNNNHPSTYNHNTNNTCNILRILIRIMILEIIIENS